MIFNLLGTPPEDEIENLEREDAKRYIKCFAARPGDGIPRKFPHVEKAACELLEKMLKFNPRERIKVDAALDDKLFAVADQGSAIRDPAKEKTAKRMISLEFEKEPDLDE